MFNWALLLILEDYKYGTLIATAVFCIHPVVNCQDPGFVEDAERQQTGLLAGDKVIYSCNPGHLLTSGDLERVCRDNGEWNGTEPVCSGTFGMLCL